MVELAQSALPATVVTAHLRSCAAELATATVPRGELTEVVEHLIAGQRHIAAALVRLSDRLDGDAATSDSAALAEVLRAAATATGHAADALAAGEHLCEIIADDTHL